MLTSVAVSLWLCCFLVYVFYVCLLCKASVMETVIAAGVVALGYIFAQDPTVAAAANSKQDPAMYTLGGGRPISGSRMADIIAEAPNAHLIYDDSRRGDLVRAEVQARAGQRWNAARDPASGIVFDPRVRPFLTEAWPHNNMNHYQTLRGARPNVTSGITDSLVSAYTGVKAEGFFGEGNDHKHELASSVFKDTVQQTGLAKGAISHLARPMEESFTNASVKKQGQLPFQPARIAPGLGDEENIGFHEPFRVLPPTVDALRAKTRPKETYRAQSGPSTAFVKTRQAPQAAVVKQKPPRNYNAEYVGTGAAAILRPKSQVNKCTIRTANKVSSEFPTGPAGTAKGLRPKSHNFQSTGPFRSEGFTDDDYVRNSNNANARRPESRDKVYTESGRSTFAGDWVHSLVTIAAGVLDFDYDNLTIKRFSERSAPEAREFKGHINGPEMQTDDIPKDTHRQYISVHDYAGTPGEMVPEGPDDAAMCAAQTSDRREVVSRGRAPADQGAKVFTGVDNTTLDPVARRDLPKERAPSFRGYNRPCKAPVGMDCSSEPIGATRVRVNAADMTDRLHVPYPQNELTVSVTKNL